MRGGVEVAFRYLAGRGGYDAALVSGAGSQGEGGPGEMELSVGTYSPCHAGTPRKELAIRRKNNRKRFSMGSAGSQGEGGPGEMELSVASDGGV